ncbi:MAG: GTP 3',8-cyclase MoaA [Flavobacteriales bacterium]
MSKSQKILTDTFNRKHTYLRISLIERCNLRCTYCMPAEGLNLTPRSHLMTYEEIYTIAKTFVENGVTKIRLTGGEPLIRKDIPFILEKLATLPVSLSITTNAVTVNRFIETFQKYGIKNINVSLDTLQKEKFKQITRRDDFEKVYKNIHVLVAEKFQVKVNVVLIKGFNDNEIIDLIKITKELPISLRFIEFMPFDGNKWNVKKLVSYQEIMKQVANSFSKENIIRLKDAPNDTSKNYKIKGFQGSFAVISTVTNPFCDSCNRLRLTADGKLKNCLFSASEADLLTSLRKGTNIEPIIKKAVQGKFKIRGGMNTSEKFQDTKLNSKNRSMITIGG